MGQLMAMDLGRVLIALGLVILGLGLVLTFADRVPLLGRLPGDVTLRGDGWTVYAPIATMIVVSVILTLAVNAIGWLQRR